MKRIIRLYDEDLRRLVMEKYDARPSQVLMCYTEEVKENGIEPVFYIEVEEDEGTTDYN